MWEVQTPEIAQTANSIAHLCTVLLKTLELSNFEERINKLEQELEIGKPPKPVTSDVRGMISTIKEKANN